MGKEDIDIQHKVHERDLSPYLQPRFHSISWRLFIYFFFISLVPIFVVGFSMIKNSEYSLETEIKNKFEFIASSKLSKLNLVIQDAQNEFKSLIADHPELIDGFSEMVEDSDFEKRDETRKKLSNLLASSKYFTSFDVVSEKDGKIIISTNRINEGRVIDDEEFFKKAKKQLTVDTFSYRDDLKIHVLNMALPLNDNNKSIIAILFGIVDLMPIDKLLTENTGLGNSGETYIVDNSNRIIVGIGNNSYYKKLSPNFRQIEIAKYKQTPIFTEGIINGLKGMEGVTTYSNYTGNQVIGFYKYTPEVGAAFLAEQFLDEALAPIHRMKTTFGWILLIILAMDLCLAIILANKITNPLAKLTDKAKLIAKGDYEALAEVSSYDEFGILAHAFNKMSETLVLSLDETKNIIEVMPSALFTLDVDGKIKSVNQSACALTAYGKETLKEMHFDDLIDNYSNNEEGEVFNLKQLEKEGTIVGVQRSFFTKSHKFIPISIAGTVLKDKKNKAIGFIIVVDDLSQIKESEYQLQSSHEKLKMAKAKTEEEKAKAVALLSSIGDGIIALDLKGNIMTMNHKSKEMFGKTLSEVIGIHYSKSFRFEDEKGRAIESNIFSVSGSIKMDMKIVFFIRPNNQKFPLSITVSPILFEDKSIGNIVSLRDITKEMEVDKAKSEFVSLASHQLRTPLTGIKWLLQEIMRKKNLDEIQTEYLEDASESSDRMINLVNDLLNVSRLETGTIKAVSKKVNLFEFLNPIVKEAICMAKEKNQEVKFDINDKKLDVILDPQLIGQVITNLLSNAIYYTGSNKTITISAEKSKKKVLIKIQDEGIGISKEDRKKLFRKFFRAKDAAKYSTTGSGLGLYIVSKILEVCSGTIECVSEIGKGTAFIITLPLKGPVNKESEKTLIFKKLFTPLKK